ncbi:MAG: hypothetical protein CVV61_01135 [Tenericutes bacterium HGW-Tenericutes-6]|nr:MAG: hypothetical protein CVV61_01135 [Tenericutes bacterium HGW-Tenericutes-6]
MIYFYDLHIHSVLSQDADELMTPHNIFNMAYLKKLDIIAVTDHNSLKNIPICAKISESYDILFIPGVEISVKEGCHILCYFKYVHEAMAFDQILEKYLDKKPYDQAIFGDQEMTDIHDEVIEVIPYDLSQTLDLSIEDLKRLLNPYEHLLVYAHIDRKKHGALEYFKVKPLNAIELTEKSNPDHYQSFKTIRNSDAHTIIHILERTKENQIELKNLTVDDFFEVFNKHD